MVRLTPYEQRMLDGEFGAAKQIALQNIIDYAKKQHDQAYSSCEIANLNRP